MKRLIWVLLLSIVLLLNGCGEEPRSEWAVTVDGTDLTGMAVTYDGVVYIQESELETALGVDAPDSLSKPIDSESWLPLYEVCEELCVSVLEDEENGRLYLTSGILGWEVPKGYTVPVLMYHAVSDDVWGDEAMFVSPSVMEEHLRYLSENGFDPIFFEDLPHVGQYDKPVILTFDDGYICNYTNLYPLLQKYQMKATISIVTSSIGNRPTSMTREMVRELADLELVSIQSHTVNHPTLTKCSLQEKKQEIIQSKLEVTRITGREPMLLCYPGGIYNNRVVKITQEHYRFGLIVDNALYTTGDDLFRIPRFSIRREMTMDEFTGILDSIEYKHGS